MVEIEELEISTAALTGGGPWIQVREGSSDVLLKLIDYKEPFKVKKPDSGDGSSSEESNPKIRIDDTVLMNIIVRHVSAKEDQPPASSDNSPSFVGEQIVMEGKSWVVTVGDLDVLHSCLEWSLLHLRAGDVAHVYAPAYEKFTFGIGGVRKYKQRNPSTGSNELYTLPPGSFILYRLEIMQIVADTSRLNPYFPIQKATTRKMIANDIYMYEWDSAGGTSRERAIRIYEKAAKDMKKLLDGTYFANVETDHPQKKQVKTLLLDCLNNITAVYISAKRYSKGRESALQILDKEDSNNVKAAIRFVKCCVLDPAGCPSNVLNDAFARADTIITYKNPTEEEELKQLKAKYNKRVSSISGKTQQCK